MTAWVESQTPGPALGPPRQKAELRQGALVALVVHALLFAALSFNIPWTPPPPTVVAAELWSAVPQSAPLPAAAEPEPVAVEPPPAKVAAPEPPVAPPKPQVPDAQIALEKEKKAQKERAEKERAEKERLEKQRAEKEKAERAKVEKLAKEKAEKAEKAEAAKRAAAEQANAAKLRDDQLKRMMGQIGSEAATGTGGTALKESAPSANYVARIVNAIFPNILFTGSLPSHLSTEVLVRANSNGMIISRKVVKESGNKEWDDAVLRAIERTGTLPRDTDGRVPSELIITFRPKN